MLLGPRLNRLDLAQPPHMTWLAAECRVQESPCQFLREFDANDTSAEHQHIHVVVLHALMSRVGIMTETGTDTPHLVCRDACAYAAAANENPPVSRTRQQGFAQHFCAV